MPAVLRLCDYPHARLRVSCGPCGRNGCWSVARLAERHGADMPLVDLIRMLTLSCPRQRRPGDPPARRYEARCLACYPDLTDGPEPASPALRLVAGGRG